MNTTELRTKWLELPARVRNWLIIAAIPTFYMPLIYIIVVVSALASLVSRGLSQGLEIDSPSWLGMAAVNLAFVITAVLCPVFLLWVWFSKRLSLREKAFWSFIIIALNMVGMPMFYVFMVRRYLGIEGRTSARDEAALDSLVTKCGLNRALLSPEQAKVLRSYCHRRRLARVGLPIALAIWIPTVYCGALVLPRAVLSSLSSDISGADATFIMMAGIVAGAVGMMGLFLIGQVVGDLLYNRERNTLMDYLKATPQRDA